MNGNNSDSGSNRLHDTSTNSVVSKSSPVDPADGLRLMRAFFRIVKGEDRRAVIELAERLAQRSSH